MTAHAETFDDVGVANTVVVDAESALEPALAIARAEVDALVVPAAAFATTRSSPRSTGPRARGEVPGLSTDAVEAALRAAAETGGLVDPTVGPALRASATTATPARRDLSPALDLVPAAGWRRVRLDRRAGTVRVRGAPSSTWGQPPKAFHPTGSSPTSVRRRGRGCSSASAATSPSPVPRPGRLARARDGRPSERRRDGPDGRGRRGWPRHIQHDSEALVRGQS